MTSTTGRLATLALAIGVVISTGRAEAGPITYTETVLANGTLNGVAYSNTLITLTGTADTTGVVTTSPVSIINPLLTLTVNVASLGVTATFTSSFVAFRSGGQGGFALATPAPRGSDLLTVNNAAFNTYDLATPFGPVSGTANINSTTSFGTNLGLFVISSVSGNGTFQAVTPAAIPEPSSLALCGVALALAGVRALRRRP